MKITPIYWPCHNGIVKSRDYEVFVDAPLLHPDSDTPVDPQTRRLLYAVQQRVRHTRECAVRLDEHQARRETTCGHEYDPFDLIGDKLRGELDIAGRREKHALNALIFYVAFGDEPGKDCPRGGAPLLDR